MRLHRTARTRFFTTLGNEVLRDNRLSFCARGILGHLLSYPDGQRADIRTLTDRTPEGRERVAAALRELERFGYLRRTIKRTPDGRVYTDVDVFDTASGASSPVTPDAGFPGSGGPATGSGGDHPVNQRGEKPSLPAPADESWAGREDDDADQEIAASAALLARVARIEPKLILGRQEALQLAPLVARWRQRGASELHILHTLTAGLPPSVITRPGLSKAGCGQSCLPNQSARRLGSNAKSAVRPSAQRGCAVPVANPKATVRGFPLSSSSD